MTAIAHIAALLVIIVLFLFRNSIPFAWSIRVFVPYFKVRLSNFSSHIMQQHHQPVTVQAFGNGKLVHLDQDLLRAPSAQGCDPFDDTWTWHHRATIDDCDFTGHLSNSSYPKNLDIARMEFAAHRLKDFLRDGGWIALASTSFHFHQEIPMLTRYSIVSRIETWTDKWLYLKNEFRGRSRHGDKIVYCTSLTKHCFKYGHKTIPPWFVLAYCGYSGASEATLLKTNATRSREVRQAIKELGGKAKNPLQAFERIDPTGMRKSFTWCSPDAWDVASWEYQRKQRLATLVENY